MSHWAEPGLKGKGNDPLKESSLSDNRSKGGAEETQCVKEDSAEADALYTQIVALLQRTDKVCIEPLEGQSPLQLLRSAPALVRKEVIIKLRGSAHLQILLNQCSTDEVAQWTAWIPDVTTPSERLIPFDNPEQAAQAQVELSGLKAIDYSGRLTDNIVELLVFGVGRRASATAIDTEGLIGIAQATRAARALIQMPQDRYLGIVSQLVMAGGTPQRACVTADPRTESVLLLKAVAARLDEFTGQSGVMAADIAAHEVATFGDEIRGKDAEQLKSDTSVRDRGKTDGLLQKYTMTCGPTAIQLVHGEADPIYALEVSKDSKHDLNYQSNVAKEQADYMNKDVVPRIVAADYARFNSLIGSVQQPDLAKAIALQQWIFGMHADPKLVSEGQALAASLGFSQSRLLEFRTYYPYLNGNNAPGWVNSTFESKANSELSSVTGGPFNERAIPLSRQTVAGNQRPVSQLTAADVDALWDALFRGIDVPMGIMWAGGGGHFMVFTSCRNTGTEDAPVREFLLSDPGSGQSAWVSETDVKNGNLSPFGTGAIDSLYLREPGL